MGKNVYRRVHLVENGQWHKAHRGLTSQIENVLGKITMKPNTQKGNVYPVQHATLISDCCPK